LVEKVKEAKQAYEEITYKASSLRAYNSVVNLASEVDLANENTDKLDAEYRSNRLPTKKDSKQPQKMASSTLSQ